MIRLKLGVAEAPASSTRCGGRDDDGQQGCAREWVHHDKISERHSVVPTTAACFHSRLDLATIASTAFIASIASVAPDSRSQPALQKGLRTRHIHKSGTPSKASGPYKHNKPVVKMLLEEDPSTVRLLPPLPPPFLEHH